MKNEPCGPRDFEEIEKQTVISTKDILNLAYPAYWFGLNVLKDAINLLIEECETTKDEAEKKHLSAILMIVNRAIQHMEGIRILNENGLYGDCFSLHRNLVSDLAMLQYLEIKPGLVELFLNEGENDYRDASSGFRDAFSEGAIAKALAAHGVKPFMNAFSILSKTSHTSAFGSQLYGTKGKKEGEYHFKYGPKLELQKALGVMAMMLPGHYNLLDNIIVHQSKKGPPDARWAQIDSKFTKLGEMVDVFTEASKATMAHLWPKEAKKITQ